MDWLEGISTKAMIALPVVTLEVSAVEIIVLPL
jgi:hypothetical protein